MKKPVLLLAVFTAYSGVLNAAPPKTDVVIETVDSVLLHVEYVTENDKASVVDVRAAIFPAALCDAKELPKYLPKGKFTGAVKLSTGDCSFIGKPFVTRSLTLAPAEIKKRYDTALLTLTKSGEKKQLPFFEATGKDVRGFDFTAPPIEVVGEAPILGIRKFAKDETMDTIQTVDMAANRKTLFPSLNIWHQWNKLDPRLGVYYTPLLPTADISILNTGVLGFTVENSFAVPELKFLPLKKYSMRLRAGINAGFHSFSQDLYQTGSTEAVSTGKITLIPVLAQITLFYDLRPKGWGMSISPFVRLADGIIFSTVSTEVKSQFISQLNTGAESSRSGSYIGNGFAGALGVEVRPDKWPVAFTLDGGYLLHSQDIAGQYFMFNVGAAWHYGVNPPEPKMIPIQYLGNKSIVMNLKGTVRTPDGKTLAGATIKLKAKGSTAVVKQVDSNDKGQYAMEVEPGLDYTLEAHKDAYANATVDLPLMSNDKKTKDQDFILAELTYSLKGVNFKPDSDQLIKGADKAILELIKFLQANPEIRIEIGGHTAAAGTDDESSRSLSKKRAESVRKFIIAKGINGDRLVSEGYGGSKPIADGKTTEGAKKNRRVEVRILVE